MGLLAPFFVMLVLPPVVMIVGLDRLTLRALKCVAPKMSRGWCVAIGSLVPVLPFWCGFLWENAHPVFIFRNPGVMISLDERWRIITQLLFVIGFVGLVAAFAAAIFFTRRARTV